MAPWPPQLFLPPDRCYRHAIEDFVAWYCSEPRLAFNKTVVLRYRLQLESRGLAPATINIRLAAVRRLAYEAADSGLLSPELAASIGRVKGAKKLGIRLGNWLTAHEGKILLGTPDAGSVRGKRDYAVLAILLGCGLRRSELVHLRMQDLQQREEHWAFVDLIGKGGHVRTVPVPNWVKTAIDQWTLAARIETGRLLRCVNKTGSIWGEGITEKVVWCVVREFAAKANLQRLAPHDLRRTCAGLASWLAEFISRWFNPSAFLLPVAGMFGNAGRNQFLGPNLTELDTSLFKTIRISERWNLQFRAEAFNILNRANFGQPSIGVYAGTPSPGAIALYELPSQSSCPNVSPSAGVITSTATTSGQLQLALKLMF